MNFFVNVFLISLSIAKVIFALRYVENIKIKFEIITHIVKKVKNKKKLLVPFKKGKILATINVTLLSLGWSKNVVVSGTIELMPIN